MGIGRFNFDHVFAVAENCAGIADQVGEVINVVHILKGAGPVFGDEKVVTIREAKAFTDIFEAVAESPADADGFFGESADLFSGFVERVFGLNPTHLIGREVFGQERFGIDFDEREDGRHKLVDGGGVDG